MTRSLLALHGFSGSGEIFERLGENITAPLLLGHGPTPDLSARTFSEEVARIAKLAASLPAPRVLAGYSQGARVALGLLVEHPQLFDKAILFSVNPGLSSPEERASRLRQEEGWIRLLRASGLQAFVSEWEKLPIFESQASWSLARLEEQRRVRLSHTAEGLEHALAVLGLGRMPNYAASLERVHVPVHLVAGELDAKFTALHRAMAARLPSATLEVLPGVGHNPLYEAAARVRHLFLPD